jgi:hypothetical protein
MVWTDLIDVAQRLLELRGRLGVQMTKEARRVTRGGRRRQRVERPRRITA